MNFKSKNMWPIYVAILAGLIAVIGAYFQVKEKEDADFEAEQAKLNAAEWNTKFEESQRNLIDESHETAKKASELAEANLKISELQEQINEKANDIIKSNQELIASQSETIKKIMGDGYSVIKVKVLNNSTMNFQVESNSKYPLYDGNIIIMDYNEIIKCVPNIDSTGKYWLSYNCINPHMTFIDQTINLNAGKFINLNTYNLPIPTSTRYLVFQQIYRNITITQYSIIWHDKTTNQINHNFRVYEANEDGYTLLLEENKNDLPETEWENNFHFLKQCYFKYD